MYNKHLIHPFASQPSRSTSSPKRIIVALNAEIYDFDSSFILPGLVIPHGALSEQQLTTLKEDVSALQDLLYEDEHFHTPHLRLDTEEDVKVLRLICDHPHKQKRRNHLKNFLYFRKHNIYVPEWVTQQSLRHPAHVIESDSGLSYEWLCPDFKYYICKYPVTPHILENLHLLARKHPVNTGIDYRTGLRVFIHLSHEEQQEMIGYTSHQIKTIMDCDWYKTHESLRLLHLERVKKNVPLVEYQFVMKFENNGEIFTVSELICAMTQAEAEDFQAILDRTQFVILHSRHMGRSVLPIFGIFAYLYFKLGSENFSELLSYLRDCQNGSHEKKSIVKTLCDSTKLQELIIALSRQDSFVLEIRA